MSEPHYLCSELVALRIDTADSTVNLEEIWRAGAMLESEDPVAAGTSVEIRCGETFFAARVTQNQQHEFGWRVEVEFSPLTPWDPERFKPQHILGLGLSRSEAE
jgi:hypothetical protein